MDFLGEEAASTDSTYRSRSGGCSCGIDEVCNAALAAFFRYSLEKKILAVRGRVVNMFNGLCYRLFRLPFFAHSYIFQGSLRTCR
jgi:hypothetical protein